MNTSLNCVNLWNYYRFERVSNLLEWHLLQWLTCHPPFYELKEEIVRDGLTVESVLFCCGWLVGWKWKQRRDRGVVRNCHCRKGRTRGEYLEKEKTNILFIGVWFDVEFSRFCVLGSFTHYHSSYYNSVALPLTFLTKPASSIR
jgi:hypothetical protein